MRLQITRKNAESLTTHYDANYTQGIITAMIGGGLLLWGIFSSPMGYLYATVFLAITIGLIVMESTYDCTIDKTTDLITYQTTWLGGSNIDVYELAHIDALEMKRHRSKGSDTFRLRLKLPDTTLNLCGDALSFSECQTLAQEIHIFLGDAVPLRAID